MANFYDVLDQYLGEQDDMTDIRAIVRRCWFYDFNGFPLRVWQGKGKLFTENSSNEIHEWLGTIDSAGNDYHKTPSIKDGRDGSSARSNFTLRLIDTPGKSAKEFYEAVRNDQWRVNGRKLTCYLAIFKEGEGLRPQTPIIYFKEFTMMNTKFSEKIESNNNSLVKKYETTVVCKDANFGRSEIPNGTYANAIQQERARQLGIDVDLGCEYVANLANRTYVIP